MELHIYTYEYGQFDKTICPIFPYPESDTKYKNLIQKTYRHFLFDVTAFQRLAEIVEWDFALATLVRFHDCALGDAYQLILADVRSDHHVQYIQQFVARNRFVVVQIVHPECNWNIQNRRLELVMEEADVAGTKYKHFNFSSRLFRLLTLFLLMGRKWASTCMNLRKLTRSSVLSAKNACTIRSHSGLMASSGMRKKSSRDNVPQSVRSSDVKRE